MSRPQVMVMSPVLPEKLSVLEATFDVLRCDTATDRDAFLQSNGQDCRAVMIKGHDSFGERDLQLLPKLEVVACATAGFEAIDHDALHRAGVAFTNSSHALKDEVADVAVMLILASARDLVACDAYVRTGEWGQKGPYPLLSSLKGKRAGILGFGMIGQEIAARLKPMKLEIGYHARGPKDIDLAFFPDPEALAEWCDILIVAVPGGAETHHLVGRNMMMKLGPKGTLINIARGSVVDEVALIDGLSSGTLRAAGLDVFQNEPHPNPALTALPNVVLYPHHASGTVETRNAMAQLAINNLVAHFRNEPLLTPIDRPTQSYKVLK